MNEAKRPKGDVCSPFDVSTQKILAGLAHVSTRGFTLLDWQLLRATLLTGVLDDTTEIHGYLQSCFQSFCESNQKEHESDWASLKAVLELVWMSKADPAFDAIIFDVAARLVPVDFVFRSLHFDGMPHKYKINTGNWPGGVSRFDHLCYLLLVDPPLSTCTLPTVFETNESLIAEFDLPGWPTKTPAELETLLVTYLRLTEGVAVDYKDLERVLEDVLMFSYEYNTPPRRFDAIRSRIMHLAILSYPCSMVLRKLLKYGRFVVEGFVGGAGSAAQSAFVSTFVEFSTKLEDSKPLVSTLVRSLKDMIPWMSKEVSGYQKIKNYLPRMFNHLLLISDVFDTQDLVHPLLLLLKLSVTDNPFFEPLADARRQFFECSDSRTVRAVFSCELFYHGYYVPVSETKKILVQCETPALYVTYFESLHSLVLADGAEEELGYMTADNVAAFLSLPQTPYANECAICLNESDEAVYVKLPCGHKFHRHCAWKQHSSQALLTNRCPLCRHLIYRQISLG